MSKSTNIEVENRVNQVLEAILEGGNTHEIIKHYSSEFNVSERQIATYIQKANKKFKDSSKLKVDQEVGKALSRYNKLFNKSLQIMDFKTCLSIQKAIIELLEIKDTIKKDDDKTITVKRASFEDE